MILWKYKIYVEAIFRTAELYLFDWELFQNEENIAQLVSYTCSTINISRFCKVPTRKIQWQYARWCPFNEFPMKIYIIDTNEIYSYGYRAQNVDRYIDEKYKNDF